jgi:DNA-binding LacI/PurR family transcriptional regulator
VWAEWEGRRESAKTEQRLSVVDGDTGPRRGRPVTLADIARAAGTSASTASRAINGKGYVSEAARARLLAAAEQLGYVPNASARTLKQKTSRVVGVVVSDLGNQFCGRLSAAIEQTLREADYQMALVGDNSQNAEELAAVRTFLAMRTPGVIMTPVSAEACQLLSRHGVSVVEVGSSTSARRMRRGRDRQRTGRARCDRAFASRGSSARCAAGRGDELDERRRTPGRIPPGP